MLMPVGWHEDRIEVSRRPSTQLASAPRLDWEHIRAAIATSLAGHSPDRIGF